MIFLALQGVMACPECKGKLKVSISADDVSFCFPALNSEAFELYLFVSSIIAFEFRSLSFV